MRLLRVTKTFFNNLKQLVIQAKAAKATYTAEEYPPFGVDGRPPEGVTVLYSTTEADGDDVIIGVLLKNRKAEVGEIRLFSTDADLALKFNIWLRNNGELLMGTSETPGDYTNFGVKFNELKTEFNKLKADYNDLKTKYNAHTHTTTCGSGAGTANAVLPAQQGPTNSSNIDNCKHSQIKYSD